MDKRNVLAIDAIMVFGSLFVIAGLVGYTQPLVIGPIDDLETSDTNVLFEFEKAEVIFIDDNLQFTSPDEIFVEENLVLNLRPGVYYWKVKGIGESKVRQLTIISEVDLKVKSSADGDKYELVNAGNVVLNVDVYQRGNKSEKVQLGVDEDKEVSGTKFVGSQEFKEESESEV
jgi:hypothetical protein